jgi:hypothetical protein
MSKKQLTPATIETHKAWRDNRIARIRRKLACRSIGEVCCESCGCIGNCECGHEPLAAPVHHCELAANDPENDRCVCYCCIATEAKS